MTTGHMTTEHKYKVFPDAPKPIQKIEPYIKGAEGISMGWGCLVWGCAFFVSLGLINLLIAYMYCGSSLCGGDYRREIQDAFSAGSGLALLSAIVVTVIAHYILKREHASKTAHQRTIYAERDEAARVISEAESITADLRHIYESSINLAAECSEHLEEASLWLKQADGEYNDNAPYPYWDAVEYTIQHLSDYEEKIYQLSENAESYYQKLRNRKHNFPLFPVTIETIPNASPLLPELRRVVRLGHTNPHFTNILGHRRTQETLIAGFRSLNEAVNNLSESIEDSISDLSESVSSHIHVLADEEIKGREVLANTLEKQDKRLLELNRMVDNIQHNHKPRFKDTPSKK